jgi:hypothetical protein
MNDADILTPEGRLPRNFNEAARVLITLTLRRRALVLRIEPNVYQFTQPPGVG